MGRTYSLSWSYSRAKAYSEGCPRRFFFHYYVDGEKEEKFARLLKRLTSLDQMAGTVVDWQINLALKEFKEQGAILQDLPDRGVRAFERLFERSPYFVDKIKKNKTMPPKEAQVLFEHFYGLDIPDRKVEFAREKVYNALFNFESSELWEHIKSLPCDQWSKSKSNSEISAVDFQFNDIRVWAAVDFSCRDGDRLHILDWKSGRESDAALKDAYFQMAVYSIWGSIAHQIPLENVTAQIVFLQSSPQWTPRTIAREHIEYATQTIEKQHKFEREKLVDHGYDDARGVHVYEARDKDFLPRPEVTKCGLCPYQVICPEGKNCLREASAHNLESILTSDDHDAFSTE